MNEIRKFNKAFKEQTVLKVTSGETIAIKMLVELGIHYFTIREWVIIYKQDGTNAFTGSGSLKPEDEEIRNSKI